MQYLLFGHLIYIYIYLTQESECKIPKLRYSKGVLHLLKMQTCIYSKE